MVPKISFLIPAYDHVAGVYNILNELSKNSKKTLEKIEVIVFDNSSDSVPVCSIVDSFNSNFPNMHYQHRFPSNGAIDNWNALLDFSSGEYCILMHHDEFPLGNKFLVDLLLEIECSHSKDFLILDCFLLWKSKKYLSRHIPWGIRSLVVRYFPVYLFRRNVIGPTATLVVKRELYGRFDENLKWLVDVDRYYGIIKNSKNFKFCKHIAIISHVDMENSITSGLKGAITDLNESELQYLENKIIKKFIWRKSSPVFDLIEKCLWFSFRLISRGGAKLYWLIGIKLISESKLRELTDDNS